MLTENINFFQRDFFALYGENEILGWFSNESSCINYSMTYRSYWTYHYWKSFQGNQTISLKMDLKECGSEATDCTFVSHSTYIWLCHMGQYLRKLIFRTDSQKVKALVQHVSLISRKLMVNGKPFTGAFIFLLHWFWTWNEYKISVNPSMDFVKITETVWSRIANVVDKHKPFAKCKKSLLL